MCRSLFRLIFAEENVKKYCLLILSLLLFLASFAVSWYGDQLFDKIFVFIIPIHIILAICFVVLLVLSIIKILKHKTHVNFASVAVLILLVIVFAFFPFRVAKTKFEFGRYEEDRIKVVEMIKNHQLQPKDEIGNIVLPTEYKRISTGGEVFEYQNNKDGQVIGFWIFRGMLSGSTELVYSSGGEELIKANETGHPITKIEKLKDNWYYVITDY